jgi:hypothetical protein
MHWRVKGLSWGWGGEFHRHQFVIEIGEVRMVREEEGEGIVRKMEREGERQFWVEKEITDENKGRCHVMGILGRSERRGILEWECIGFKGWIHFGMEGTHFTEAEYIRRSPEELFKDFKEGFC